MANILFEIGDWSGDGHNTSAEFIVQTNKTLKEVRSIHLKENDFIGSLCSDYEDSCISLSMLIDFLGEYLTKDQIKKFIINIAENEDNNTEVDYLSNPAFVQMAENVEEVLEDEVIVVSTPTFMLTIWLELLKVIDPSFEYQILTEPMSPYYIKYKGYPETHVGTIHYGGFINNVHLLTPGYGIWSGEDTEFMRGY